MLKKSYYICCLNTDEIAEYIGNKIESLRSLKLEEALQLWCQKRLVHLHQTLQPDVVFEMAQYWEIQNYSNIQFQISCQLQILRAIGDEVRFKYFGKGTLGINR